MSLGWMTVPQHHEVGVPGLREDDAISVILAERRWDWMVAARENSALLARGRWWSSSRNTTESAAPRLAGMGMVEDLLMKETFVACTKHVDEVQFTRIDDRWQWDGESFDGDFEFDRSSDWRAAATSPGQWEEEREKREDRWGFLNS